MTLMRCGCVLGLLTLWLSCGAPAAELKRETIQAFEGYVRAAETRISDQAAGRRGFLWTDESRQRLDQVRGGQVITQIWNGKGPEPVADGLIHDWIGAVFVPGAKLEQVLAMVRNYDNHYRIYQPEVIDSKTLAHEKDHYKVYLRLLKKKVVTVVLNTEHDVQYFPIDRTRWCSRSYSTRIAQVENAGESKEKELPVGDDNGFLWRLNSYWRFQERDGGVYMECEAISLTRDIPTGLGWLVEPVIRDLPKESLARTLAGTRRALQR